MGPDLFAPPTSDELKGAQQDLFSPPTPDELGSSAPTRGKPTMAGVRSFLDKNAKEMGFKDNADMTDKMGNAVMGGQIASLAGPAMNTLKNLAGKVLGGAAPMAAETAGGAGAALAPEAEAEAPALLREAGAASESAPSVSTSGPIRNLPRPGSPLFEPTPTVPPVAAPPVSPAAARGAIELGNAATDSAPEVTSFAGAKDALNQAVQKSPGLKDVLLHLATKHPTIGAALGVGGIGGAIHEAMKHPEAAAVLAAIGIGGPLVPMAAGMVGDQIGREEAVKRAIKARKGRR